MHIPDRQRPMVAAGLIIVISLAFAAGRYTVGRFVNTPAREEAVAIQAYREGDTGDALPVFEQLARHGDATAAYYLGQMYQYGDGVGRDGAQAVKWLTRSARAGHVRAARQLGLLYLDGQDRLQDLAAARHWLDTAARQGDPIALRHLGHMNQDGLGARADPVAAYADYAAAAVHGDGEAANLRDALASRLSADQQARGAQLADHLASPATPSAATTSTAQAKATPGPQASTPATPGPSH